MEGKLSVCLIVKDEEKHLDRCLRSVRNADEIVVVDTGSRDKTCEIARKYTNRVIENEYKWNDNFAEARNFAKSKCKGDWILSIDADEELKSGIEEVRQATKTGKDAVGVNLVSQRGGEVHQFPRLFRNKKEAYWKGAIHNHLSVSDYDKSDLVIEYGYSEAHKKDPDRALRILGRVVREKPDCTREKYYLAREYWYRRWYAKAARWYEKYLEVGKWPPEVADAWLMKARCEWALRQGDKARRSCLMAIGVNPNFREAILFMAEMSFPKNKKRWREVARTADNSNVLFIRKTMDMAKRKQALQKQLSQLQQEEVRVREARLRTEGALLLIKEEEGSKEDGKRRPGSTVPNVPGKKADGPGKGDVRDSSKG